jgi:transaldolase
MLLFLDSALPDEITLALEEWDVDGITTNPRHIAAAGRPLFPLLHEIARLVEGTDKPVSVEVDPHLTDWREIVRQAQQLAELSPNFVVKIGASEGGMRAVRELSRLGIRTNVTLVFSVAQAWLAARSGAAYVSPFIGWKEMHGDDGMQLVADVAQLLHVQDYPTQVIAAAVRNAQHIAAAALAGAHCVTAGAGVIRDSFRNPYTDMGVQLFGDAWERTVPRHSGEPGG